MDKVISGGPSTIKQAGSSNATSGKNSGVRFSGWLGKNEGDTLVTSQKPKKFARLRNLRVILKYFKQPESRKLLFGIINHYAVPVAFGFSLLTPIGWLAAPITFPAQLFLSKRGGKVIDKMKLDGKINAKAGPLEAITSIQKTWEEELTSKISQETGETVLDDVVKQINKTKAPGQKITKEMLSNPKINREVMEQFVKRQSGLVISEYNDLITEMLKMGQKENVSAEEFKRMHTFLHAKNEGRLRKTLNWVLEGKHTVRNTMFGKAARPFNSIGSKRWMPKLLRWPFRGVALMLQSVAVFTKSPTFHRLFRRATRL